MAYAGDPFSTLHFGDFDADGKTDVFATSFVSPKTQWRYSSGGVGNYQNLVVGDRGSTSPLAFGRFDGDAKTDVFAVQLDREQLRFLVLVWWLGGLHLPVLPQLR